jgi:cold shock CspA family protein
VFITNLVKNVKKLPLKRIISFRKIKSKMMMNFKTFDMTFSDYEEKWEQYKAKHGITHEWYDEEDEDDIDLSSSIAPSTSTEIEVKEDEFQEVVAKKVKKMIKNHYNGTVYKFFTKNNFGYLQIEGISKDVMFQRNQLKSNKRPYIGTKVKVEQIEEKNGKFTAFGVKMA